MSKQSAFKYCNLLSYFMYLENNKTTGLVGLVNGDLCFSVIHGLLSVLVYGILFYPFFACLTTKYKLIGSLMGFVYAAIRYKALMIIMFKEKIST